MAKRLVIVGSAPEPSQLSGDANLAVSIARFIDGSDFVVRMNNLKNIEFDWIGRRTDMLAIANTGRPGWRYANELKIRFDPVEPPSEIFWAYGRLQLFRARFSGWPDPYHGTDFADRISRHQGWQALMQTRMPVTQAAHLDILVSATARRWCLASTGMRAIWHVTRSRRFAGFRKYFVGFGFEGWSGHAFDAERKLVGALTHRTRISPLTEADLDVPDRIRNTVRIR